MTHDIRFKCLELAATRYGSHAVPADKITAAAQEFYNFVCPPPPPTIPADAINISEMPQQKSGTITPIKTNQAVPHTAATEKPEPRPTETTGGGAPMPDLTKTQTEWLNVMIALHKDAVNITYNAIADAMETTKTPARNMVAKLISMGYVRETRVHKRHICFVPVYRPDGTKVTGEVETVDAAGKIITQCPPGYGAGYNPRYMEGLHNGRR